MKISTYLFLGRFVIIAKGNSQTIRRIWFSVRKASHTPNHTLDIVLSEGMSLPITPDSGSLISYRLTTIDTTMRRIVYNLTGNSPNSAAQ